MSIQKITLATALLLALTACSSGSKGTDHTARQENAKLQTQVKALQQKAEEAQKKADLATERAKKAEQAVNSASKNAKEIEALKREAVQAKAEAEKAKQNVSNTLNTLNNKVRETQTKADIAMERLKQAEQAVNSESKNAKEIEALKREAAQAKAEAEKAKQNVSNTLNALNNKIKETQTKADLAEERVKQAEQALNLATENKREIETLKREAATAKAEAEQAKKDLENTVNSIDTKVQEALKRAEEEQIKADKARQENIKNLTKVAEKSGLNRWQAQDLAYKHSGLNEQEFRKLLDDRAAKHRELTALAKDSGFPEWERENFANRYLDEDLEDAKQEANRRKKEELNSKRETLAELAKKSGLFANSSDYSSFIENYLFADISSAQADLENRKQERDREIELNKKRETLTALARESGLFTNESDYNDFANSYLYSDINSAQADLENRKQERDREIELNKKRETLTALARESGLFTNESDYSDFANNYLYSDISFALDDLENRKQEQKRNKLYGLANELNISNSSDFIEKNLNNDIDQLRNKWNELISLAQQYGYEITHYMSANDFANNYIDKNIDELRNELENKKNKRDALISLAEKYGSEITYYSSEGEFANHYMDRNLNEVRSELEARKQELDSKRQTLMNLAKNSGLFSSDDEYHNFVNNYLHNDISNAESEISSLKRAKLKELISGYGYYYYIAKSEEEFISENLDRNLNEVREELEKRSQIANDLADKRYQLAIERGIDENEASSFSSYIRYSSIAQESDEEREAALNAYIKEISFNNQSHFITITNDTPQGFSARLAEVVVPVFDSNGFKTGENKAQSYIDLYKQQYSAVIAKYDSEYYDDYRIKSPKMNDYDKHIVGFITPEKNMPLEGKATYQGVAFGQDKQGSLTYKVDFGRKEGQGEITGLYPEKLILEKGNIGKRYDKFMGVAGYINTQEGMGGGNYVLDFYGPKAEEVAGAGQYNGDIGLAGTRGEIRK